MNNISRYLPHYRAHMQLAIPVVISMAGQTLTGMVDNAMVGRVDTLSLAASAFANNVVIIPLVFVAGFAAGITPLVGDSFGKGQYGPIGHYLRHSLLMTLLLVTAVTFLLMGSSPLLYHMGQEVEVVDKAVPFFQVVVFSLIPLAIFNVLMKTAEGVASTKAAMVFSLAGNLLNVLLNYLLIYGNGGFEAMGLVGAGVATLIARIFMAVGMALYVLSSRRFRPFLSHFFQTKLEWSYCSRLLSLGLPVGAQYLTEVAAFAIGAIIVGQIGKVELAAHQVAIGTASFTYMVANGLAAAATIRNSNLKGAGQIGELRIATWAGLHIAMLWMGTGALVFVLGNRFIPSLYSHDQSLIELAAPLMLIAALFQLVDGLQVVMLGALRGLEDVKMPALIAVIAYWGVSLPAGYVLAMHLGMRQQGVWVGFLLGLTVAAALLLWRFERLTQAYKQLKQDASPA